MKFTIDIQGKFDTGYMDAVEETPLDSIEHVVRVVADALFSEDFATLIEGELTVTGVTETGTSFRETRNEDETEVERHRRWGWMKTP